MSIAIMTEVWKSSRLAGTPLLLALALADHCNDDRVCWPSIGYLAAKVRLSERHTTRLLQQMADEGHLIIHANKGRNGTNLYEMPTVDQMQSLEAFTPKPWSSQRGGDGCVTLTDMSGGGDGHVRGGVTDMSPKPSGTIIEPSDVGAPSAPPVKAPPRARSERDKARDLLQEHFIRRTKLPPPRDATEAQKKEAGRLWWTPLREIGDLAGWNVHDGERLIDRALEALDGLTISDPNSIIKTARSLKAEHTRAAIGNDDEAQAVLQRMERDRMQFGGANNGQTKQDGEAGATTGRPGAVPVRDGTVGGAAIRQPVQRNEGRDARARWRSRT